jgi:hypothetical protein
MSHRCVTTKWKGAVSYVCHNTVVEGVTCRWQHPSEFVINTSKQACSHGLQRVGYDKLAKEKLLDNLNEINLPAYPYGCVGTRPAHTCTYYCRFSVLQRK